MRALVFGIAVVTAALLARRPAEASPVKPAAQVAKPWLGIAITQGSRGVQVLEVIPGTPAERVGLARGDQIVAVGETATPTLELFRGVMAGAAVGDVLRVTVQRDGGARRIHIVLGPRPSDQQVVRDRLVGKPAPEFSLPRVGAKGHLALRRLVGSVVVVEFWATWCRACRSTHSALAELDAASNKIKVLGISSEQDALLRRYAGEFAPGFDLLRDPGGKVQASYWAGVIPTVIVIDATGTVRYVGIGAGPDTATAITVARRLAGVGSAPSGQEPSSLP